MVEKRAPSQPLRLACVDVLVAADQALKLQLLWKGWKGFLMLKNMRLGLSRGVFSGMTAALLSSVGNRLW